MAEINATVSATVINRATISLDSFNISSSSVTQGGSVSFTAAFNNTGNSNASFIVTVYLINRNNATVQTIAFSPVIIIEGESAVVTKSSAISAVPGNYTVVATGSYGPYSSNNRTSNLLVNTAPSAPIVDGGTFFFFVPSTPPIISAERPSVTSLDLIDGEQLSVSFYPPGEEVRAYTSSFGSGLTGITAIGLTLGKRTDDARIIIRLIQNYPAGVPDSPQSFYNRLSVEVINIDPLDIQNLSISFKVPRNYEAGKFDKNSVALYRYADNKWNRLPTSLISSDDTFFYYSATSPGLSYFAIVAEAPQPFSVISYPMVEETPPGRLVTHTVAIHNPNIEASSGSVSLSGVPQEWVVDPVRTVNIAPLSSLNVNFMIFIPSNATLGESALRTDVQFGESKRNILTALRIIGPKENGIYVYRTMTANTERNETRVSLSSENTLQTRADVVEVTETLPRQLLSSSISFITEPIGYSNGTISYSFSLDPGGKRVDEFVVGSLLDSYSVYMGWLVDQVSTVSFAAPAIDIDSLYSTPFAPAGQGKVNITLVNHGTSPTAVILKLILPGQWLAVPFEISDAVPPRSKSTYEFDVTAPVDIGVGTYSGKAVVSYGESSLEAPLPLVVTKPAVTMIQIGGLSFSATMLALAIVLITVLIAILRLFRNKVIQKAQAVSVLPAPAATKHAITVLSLKDGDQVNVPSCSPGEEMRADTSPSCSNLTGVMRVVLTASKRITNARIVIRLLPSSHPSMVSVPPVLYKPLIMDANINPADIKGLSISFKVPRAWQNGKFDKNSVSLYRFADNKWNRLPTSFISSGENFFYYVATSPGFSCFAIVADVKR